MRERHSIRFWSYHRGLGNHDGPSMTARHSPKDPVNATLMPSRTNSFGLVRNHQKLLAFHAQLDFGTVVWADFEVSHNDLPNSSNLTGV